MDPPREDALQRNAVGLPAVLFQSITYMAPALAVALSLTPGFLVAGGSLPLALVLAVVAILCVASSIGELARHLPPSAGGLYSYAANGIHPNAGYVVAALITLAYFIALPFVTVILGGLVGGELNTAFGWPYAPLWITFTVLVTLFAMALNYFNVRITTKTGLILGAAELIVFTALALTLIIEAGSRNTFSVFGTGFANVSGFEGFKGVAAASIYTILALIGFEAAAPLGEESRNPRRYIKFAVIGSALLIGLFYLLNAYGASVYYGPARVASGFAKITSGNPFDTLARSVWGGGWVIVFLAVVNSSVASSNAITLAGPRMWYGLGRIRLFPSVFARTHPRWKTPYVAMLTFGLLSLPPAIVLGAVYDPFTAFTLLGTIYTGLLIAIYILVSIACVVYFARHPTEKFNLLRHGLIPLVGIAVMVPAFMTALGIGSSFLFFVSPLKPPISASGPVLIGVAVVVVVWFVYLRTQHPDRLARIGTIFVDDTEDSLEPAEVGAAVPGAAPQTVIAPKS